MFYELAIESQTNHSTQKWSCVTETRSELNLRRIFNSAILAYVFEKMNVSVFN